MKIYLLRHGQTPWNKERRLQGIQDIPMTPNGAQQLRQAGRHLADTDVIFDAIVCSPLQRARESARLVAEELGFPTDKIVINPLFLERAFGDGEGLVYEEALAKYPDSNYPGMETLDELFARAKKAISHCEEQYKDQTVLAVAHGGIIKACLVAASQGKIDYFDKHIWIDNGCYCVLEGQKDSWSITFHNRSNGYEPLKINP